jgi:acyl-CoA reductase-like NAD-dependent aldehyde dehydrogenase
VYIVPQQFYFLLPSFRNTQVAAAQKAFALGSEWRSMDASGRRDLLWKLAALMERDADFLAELEALDNGKPIGNEGQYGSRVDVGLCIKHYRYYAGWADKLQGSTIPVEGNNLCYTRKEPGTDGFVGAWIKMCGIFQLFQLTLLRFFQ